MYTTRHGPVVRLTEARGFRLPSERTCGRDHKKQGDNMNTARQRLESNPTEEQKRSEGLSSEFGQRGLPESDLSLM